MLDRSTRTFWAVGFLVTAVLVILWLFVRERPIQEWWIALLLVIASGVMFLLGRQAVPEAEAAQPGEAAQPQVREFDLTGRVEALPAVSASLITSAPAAAPPPTATLPVTAAVDSIEATVDPAPAQAPVSAAFAAAQEPLAAEAPVEAPKTRRKKAEAEDKPKAAKPRVKKADKPESPAQPDDLKIVEGIGPKMEAALNAAGIMTFAQLAASSEDTLRAAIEKAGMRFAPSVPTWARQAQYAAEGDLEGLKAYQESLTAGRPN
jgi:predicted flap endonuclease-1-like 5' DNA nuclease